MLLYESSGYSWYSLSKKDFFATGKRVWRSAWVPAAVVMLWLP